MSSKYVKCIRSETENYLEEDINKEIKNKSNVLKIKIFNHQSKDSEGYWIAFIIYSMEHA